MITEKMCKAHIASLLKIENECFSSPWSEQSYINELSNKTALDFAAIKDGKPVGCICMNVFDEEACINKIMVATACRRQGVAKALMEKALTYLGSSGVKSVTLEVRRSNNPALNLYKTFGFRSIGERKNFYIKPNEDAIIMAKEIKC